KTLLLPAGKIDSALADDGLKSLRELREDGAKGGHLAGALDFGHRVRQSHRQVLKNAGLKYLRILRQQQGGGAQVPKVRHPKPIDRNRDALGLHQTGESAKKRGLPSAARAHQSNALAPMQLQGDVVQRWPEAPSPGVEEAQALDLDFLPAFRH